MNVIPLPIINWSYLAYGRISNSGKNIVIIHKVQQLHEIAWSRLKAWTCVNKCSIQIKDDA